ncbi:hypothetical protein ABZV58_08110 [Nocardia sp. NPDC004654]|uniref:hypothetical protein n=1 Tax=Nocardia sp. NPDC004654 TaxID=3154776 RepID=UPI0033A571EF
MGEAMPDGYDRDREKVENNIRGRVFENGCDRFFRDRENGYVKQSRGYESGGQKIEFDKEKDERERTSTIEEKSGRMEGRKDRKQLEVVRDLLAREEIEHHTLRSVEGEFIAKDVQKLIDGLKRDFPDRFTHQVISRSDAQRIWAIGLQLERGQQLELPGVGEKAREQRERNAQAKERESRGPAKQVQARDKQPPARTPQQVLADQKQALAKEVAEQTRRLAEAQERGNPIPTKQLRQTHNNLSQQLHIIRETENTHARQALESAGLTRDHIQQMDSILRANREATRAETVRGIDAIGATAREAERVAEERAKEAANREQTRERNHALGLTPEVTHVLNLSGPQPMPGPDRTTITPADLARRERGAHEARERDERARQERIHGRNPGAT